MGRKVYIGNMNYKTTEERLGEVFQEYGEVVSINIIKDKDTGRPRGFAFIEMSSDEEANKAISSLNGSDLDGRQIKVNEAKERRDFKQERFSR